MIDVAKFPPPRVKAWATTASIGELVRTIQTAATLLAESKNEEFQSQMVEVIKAAKWEIGSRCWRPAEKTGPGDV